MGALRAAAQVVSYELILGLALIAVVLTVGDTKLSTIVQQQHDGVWLVFLQPVAFVLYLIAACAETNRAPFDLPKRRPNWSLATTPSIRACAWVILHR